MTEKELQVIYSKINELLSGRKLKPAFDQLKKMISETGLGQFLDEYYNLEQTYRFMLKYTVEGIRDPERQKIYRHLMISVYELADKVYETLNLKSSLSVVYQKKRYTGSSYIADLDDFITRIEDLQIQMELNEEAYESSGGNDKETALWAENQQNIIRLFYHILLLDELKDAAKKPLDRFFNSPYIISEWKGLITTALSFSLLRYFDEQKTTLHFELAENAEDTVSKQRALVGLLLVFYQYEKRILLYPDLTSRLEILTESPGLKKNLKKMILQFIGSKETEKIRKKIQEEIIPEMIRISPNIRNKLNIENLFEEGATDDKNPEWGEIFNDSPGLLEKMEEITKMQMEGADVFLSSFALLKTFPFFSEMANWFIPFFKDHPEIKGLFSLQPDNPEKKIIESLLISPILCNSDKYSFCMVLGSIPRENKEMMSEALRAEMEQLSEIEKDEQLVKPDRKEEIISNQYIQDLYRFFKLYPGKKDFDDIFNWRFDFHNKISFRKIFGEDMNLLRDIGEFYFVKNYFSEALEIFNPISETRVNGELLQKIAYCHQKLGNFEKALETYRKAELYDLNQLWNLKKIALCYRNLKRYGEALEIYQAVEKLDPDNLNTHFAIGYCHVELKEYQEALKYFFKIEYLSPGNKKVRRPIGWCSFLTGKLEQAEKYYSMLVEDSPDKYDLMNMGHVQWSLGNRKSALEFYSRSVREGGFKESEFIASFDEDLQHLLSRGIENDDVPIMLDQLRYFLEE